MIFSKTLIKAIWGLYKEQKTFYGLLCLPYENKLIGQISHFRIKSSDNFR